MQKVRVPGNISLSLQRTFLPNSAILKRPLSIANLKFENLPKGTKKNLQHMLQDGLVVEQIHRAQDNLLTIAVPNSSFKGDLAKLSISHGTADEEMRLKVEKTGRGITFGDNFEFKADLEIKENPKEFSLNELHQFSPIRIINSIFSKN